MRLKPQHSDCHLIISHLQLVCLHSSKHTLKMSVTEQSLFVRTLVFILKNQTKKNPNIVLMQINCIPIFSPINRKKLWEVMDTECENFNVHLKVTEYQISYHKPLNYTLGCKSFYFSLIFFSFVEGIYISFLFSFHQSNSSFVRSQRYEMLSTELHDGLFLSQERAATFKDICRPS